MRRRSGTSFPAEKNKSIYSSDGTTASFSTVLTFGANIEVTLLKIVNLAGVMNNSVKKITFILEQAVMGSARTVNISVRLVAHSSAPSTKLFLAKPNVTQTTDLSRDGISPRVRMRRVHQWPRHGWQIIAIALILLLPK